MSDPFALDDDWPLPPAAPSFRSAADLPGGGPSGRAPAPEQPPAPWLDGLNPEQRLAVETTEGPLLVLSGAGTGKTKVLTTRLAHLLLTGRARPWNCLAVTFTNKAAREMRDRVAGLVGPESESLWLGTFHALGTRMLRRHAALAGLEDNFTILDSDDQLRLVKQLLEAQQIDPKALPPQLVLSRIQRWKDRALPPERLPAEDAADLKGRGGQLYSLYQERLRALNACDFGDLLLLPLMLLQNPEHRAVLQNYQNQFRYILVDEYQDTNVAQYLWLRLLAQKHRNLCCVGDDDQSIYSWRGAEVGNILKFEQDFPGAGVIRLERNYRSTPAILAAASGLIAHNASRLGKTLRPALSGQDGDEKVMVRGLWDSQDEARWVAEQLEGEQRLGRPLRNCAILVRAGFQTREFEERLLAVGLPYRVIGGQRFYERQEIRDAMAYLRVMMQPADDLAFERIVNVPKRGLGESTLQQVRQCARDQKQPLLPAARQMVQGTLLKPKPRATLDALVASFIRWRGLVEEMDHGPLVDLILDESGLREMWRKENTPDAKGRLENLEELVRAVENYDSLAAFLEHVALVMDAEDKGDTDQVTLMTLHAAKGLEFETVFLPGWEEGLFPHQRAIDEGGEAGLEEERRLAYVGLTRARRRALVSYAASRRIYGQWQSSLPSRFLDELPGDAVIRQAARGLFDGTPQHSSGWRDDWGRQGGWENRRARNEESSDSTGQRHSMADDSRRWRNDSDLRGADPRRPHERPAATPASRPAIGGSSAAAPSRPAKGKAARAKFAVGSRVRHGIFGEGTVEGSDGDKLIVRFADDSLKKIVDSYVTAAYTSERKE